jgi:hypothetical protein
MTWRQKIQARMSGIYSGASLRPKSYLKAFAMGIMSSIDREHEIADGVISAASDNVAKRAGAMGMWSIL